ncbi:MAG: hypothetical protein HY042_08580, partial [Spirochaetia bacterium]|nr:hypothetical protein [Spirochaetia bacterium]
MKGIAERLVLLLAVGLALAACRGQGPTVEAGDPAFVVREGRLFYNEQPFTGVVRSVIPALNQVELTAF